MTTIKRRTPLKRTAKLRSNSRPKAKGSTRYRNVKMRKLSIARDGDRCEFERLTAVGFVFTSYRMDTVQFGWAPCGELATATAHIFPRRECGKFWDFPTVVVRACDRCHVAYDSHMKGVRVPPARELDAYAFLSVVCKIPPKLRLPEVA